MSGSYYALNAKYNQLLALINAGGGGGGGSVNNPMTSDLNAGGYNITNVANITGVGGGFTGAVSASQLTATTSLLTPEINQTTAPTYSNLGAIVAGNNYELARIPTATDAEGSILILLRGLDAGFKQQVFLQVIGYSNKSVIRILSNVSESDTPIFDSISYGEDAGAVGENVLTFGCSFGSATCEVAFYQNQAGAGTGAYGSFFVPATALSAPITLSSTYATTGLTQFTAGTSGNFKVDATLTAPDGDIATLQSDTISSLAGGDINVNTQTNFNANVDMATTNITKANSIQLDTLTKYTGTDIVYDANLDIQNNDILNTLDDFVYFGDNIDLKGNSLYNVNQLIGAGAGVSDITVNAPTLQLGGNAISGVSTIATDGITENTVGNGIIINNETSMTNNKIINLGVPTANTDAATKLYVDTTAGSSGVQNPMVANLDGGGFNITNVNGMTATQLSTSGGGLMTSAGTFQHGGLSVGDFGVGGDTITFAPSTSWKIKNFGLSTTYFDYDQSTQTLTTENGARQELASGSVMEVKSSAEIAVATGGKVNAAGGGSIVFNSTAAPVTDYGEMSMLDVNGLGISTLPQINSTVDTGVGIPQVIGCSTIVNARCDCSTRPFDTGTSWDNASDGTIFYITDSNSLVYQEGLPRGVNNHDNNQIVFSGWMVGLGANNASNLGGWSFTGGASAEVCDGAGNPFPNPIILGDVSSSFNQENLVFPQTAWIRANNPNLGGINLTIRLNIPPASTINVNDPQNLNVNLNKVIIQQIPIT